VKPNRPLVHPRVRWGDEARAELQAVLDDSKTAPPPTRNEVLSAFPELLPKPKAHATEEETE
jgi:hypothetical protein